MLNVKKLFIKLIPEKVTITGTTSVSGAISIPAEYQSKTLYGLSSSGEEALLVYRRGTLYLTVMSQTGSGYTLVPYASQNVTITGFAL